MSVQLSRFMGGGDSVERGGSSGVILHRCPDGGPGLCCTNRVTGGFSFLRPDLSHGFRDRDSERSEAVQYGDMKLELDDLTVEVPRHEALTRRMDAAPAVIPAASSPERAAEVF